ncbi:hypothetical protein L5876_07405 [Hyphobacterium sp. SN044]|uniref:hypothetical protein n=1 Tax=Hyphobacterium sp. SN044 TaxID=2912575 RepID=UPI001F1D2286|nr:hypothetical protein [Hyphobacterium sp. SN044]MCF8879635.1 hypothetical protein [Hyphobacterium sp. SN044]
MTRVIEIDLETHQLIEAQRQTLEEKQLDIIKRALRAAAREALSSGTGSPRPNGPARERRTGNYPVFLDGRRWLAGSQKAAYKQALIWLAERDPSLLPRLSREMAGARRIVARSHAALYPRKPGLAATLVPEILCDGWYVDLNLSKDQKVKRLMTACALAGLEYGKDVVVEFD